MARMYEKLLMKCTKKKYIQSKQQVNSYLTSKYAYIQFTGLTYKHASTCTHARVHTHVHKHTHTHRHSAHLLSPFDITYKQRATNCNMHKHLLNGFHAGNIMEKGFRF
jgi:hypothetical protein